MSELINNSQERKTKLKELILKLHAGESQENVRHELMEGLKGIPYGEVVEVEQDLISEGLRKKKSCGFAMHIRRFWRDTSI